jgi:hypothetical protein
LVQQYFLSAHWGQAETTAEVSQAGGRGKRWSDEAGCKIELCLGARLPKASREFWGFSDFLL